MEIPSEICQVLHKTDQAVVIATKAGCKKRPYSVSAGQRVLVAQVGSALAQCYALAHTGFLSSFI